MEQESALALLAQFLVPTTYILDEFDEILNKTSPLY